MIRKKASVRSRGSSSSYPHDDNPKKRIKEYCLKFIAFMCTQVGVGALIVVYALVGAATFQYIELNTEPDIDYYRIDEVKYLRLNTSQELWIYIESLNKFEIDMSTWENKTHDVLKSFQDEVSNFIKKGYNTHTKEDIWSFSAALMFSLSVFTMIGYGNLVPRTSWGKGVTVIYATFGIPLYILYFLNIGKVFAQTFKFLYTVLHECTHEKDDKDDNDDIDQIPPKKIIVPSTACLWVISFYVLIGTIMFSTWEQWSFLDSIYFCVTSLCKIGFGDFVPGAQASISAHDKQIKLAINFIYMLIGMGLVAMCYNLMREEVRMKIKEIKDDLKICLDDMHNRFGGWCGRDYVDYDEEYCY